MVGEQRVHDEQQQDEGECDDDYDDDVDNSDHMFYRVLYDIRDIHDKCYIHREL